MEGYLEYKSDKVYEAKCENSPYAYSCEGFEYIIPPKKSEFDPVGAFIDKLSLSIVLKEKENN